MTLGRLAISELFVYTFIAQHSSSDGGVRRGILSYGLVVD